MRLSFLSFYVAMGSFSSREDVELERLWRVCYHGAKNIVISLPSLTEGTSEGTRKVYRYLLPLIDWPG